ncbi:unnamed protein product [Cladocopium goreaui]|uniref:Right handed beta helix domain-containing protein n=1 Tax=Cladocopium goreaui TaxID=2562237 RepID=A0A9P1C0U7_9DINO|nr:unnamed protein product [Cladocopium goreaui]
MDESPAEAKEIFEKLQGVGPQRRFQKPFLWNLVLKACVTAKDWPSAEAWFTHIPRALRSSKGYSKLLTAAAQDVNSGGPLVAESVLRRAERASVALEICGYGALLDGCAAKGDADRAVAWLHRLQRDELCDWRALQAVLRSQATQGQVQEAEHLLNTAAETTGGTLRLQRLQRLQLMARRSPLAVLEELEKAPVADPHLYTSLLRAFADNSDTQHVRRLLHHEAATAWQSSAAFTTAIAAVAKRKDFRSAVLLLAEMLDAGFQPSVATWTALLSARRDGAKAFLEELRECEIQPAEDPLTWGVTYGAVLASVASQPEASELLSSMRRDDVTPTAVAYTVRRRQGQVEEAEKLLGSTSTWSISSTVQWRLGEFVAQQRWVEVVDSAEESLENDNADRTGSDDDLMVNPETPSPPPRLSRGLKDVALLRGTSLAHILRGAARELRNLTPAMLISSAIALTCTVLCRARVLPVVVLPELGFAFFPWALLFGYSSFFLVLATWQHVAPCVSRRRPSYFLDKFCVHQTDLELKHAGVSSFAAFVSMSDCVLLLWSPTYFKRLWCMLVSPSPAVESPHCWLHVL